MFEGTAVAAVLFALAVTVHNIEEWIWLPSFPLPPSLKPASPFAFRFAVVAITPIFWVVPFGLALGFPLEPVLAADDRPRSVLLSRQGRAKGQRQFVGAHERGNQRCAIIRR